MGLKDKSSKINFGALPGLGAPATSTSAELRPKTAPGALLAHVNDQRSALLQENERLRLEAEQVGALRAEVESQAAELRQWEGAEATRRLDPATVHPSRWANRDSRSFETNEFQELKAEIASAGGNVQPIKVRPVKPTAAEPQEFEIVFGHRRHRACLELGLPVLAVIESLGEQELFVEMDRENRARKNLSAWEQGMAYRRALDAGLFPSNRKMAEKLGIDLSQVGKALALAGLPEEAVAAFDSPLDLQYRFAKPLTEASAADPEGFKARAIAAAALGPGRDAKVVLEALLGQTEGSRTVPPPIIRTRDGRRLFELQADKKGRVSLAVEPKLIPADRLEDLADMIERFLSASSMRRQ
jgi:ParB family chromosome partitioning protein